MHKMKFAIFFAGISAVISQTLIIREGLSLFGGNELVSGILLCFWLVWVGVGSLVFTKIKLRFAPLATYAFLLLILSIFTPYTITFMRCAPRLFSFPFGETIAFVKIIYVAIIALAPTCMVFGSLFPAAARVLEPEKVYFVEGVGSFFGGIIISFVLIEILPPYGILLIVMFLLMFFSFLLLQKRLLFLPFILLVLFVKIDDFELFFRKIQMGEQNLIGLKESKYGVIAVTESGTQVNFYVNGLYNFSYPDLYSSEEAVHYPLLLHQSPERVLLVGGGIGNCITQIAKHPDVKNITYCELDPAFFTMGEKYIGEHLSKFKNLKIIFGDARFFIKNTHERYDVIIINLPDPMNAQLNRFYTKEFFAETKKIISNKGILSIRVTAPSDIISPLFGQLLNTMYGSMRGSFNNILSLPVAKTTFIATDSVIALEDVVDILASRIRERNLDLTYVNDYFFAYNLITEKLYYLKERIEESEGVINTDLKPSCYYFTTILWGGVLSNQLKKGFVTLFGFSPVLFLLPLLFVFFFFRRRAIIYLSIFSIGASEIAAEVVLIILFQIVYGYLYGWIGAIIACYMLGLASGTLFYLKSPYFKTNLISRLSTLEFGMALYFMVIIMLSLIKAPGANLFIPFLIFIGGFLGGVHFPLSVGILKRNRAGVVYGVDLIGSSLGALITAVIFIPILGIVFSLFIFVILNLLVGIGLRTI